MTSGDNQQKPLGTTTQTRRNPEMDSGIKAPVEQSASESLPSVKKEEDTSAESPPLRLVSVQPDAPSNPELLLDQTVLPTLRPPPPDLTDPYLGCVIDGRYRVESVLGEGGMGIVYGCKHKHIEKRIAIKILRADLARDPEVTSRFLNEARSASSIGNPHIIDISDFGILPDGSTYFVMEYLDGQPLSQVVATEGALPLPRLLHIARQLAEGLSAAHHADIVHRDLKPDNIFLVAHGAEPDFVKILDFGIAKVSTAEGRITRAGTVFGTPHYMSPEQAAGTPVDLRGDIYSFGVILYELASGRLPFDADNFMGILSQHMYKAPTPFGSLVPPLEGPISAGLEAIVLKCLSKQPEQRYASVDALIEDLDRLRDGQTPVAVAEVSARTAEYSVPLDYFKRDTQSELARPRRLSQQLIMYLGVFAILIAVGIVSALIAKSTSRDTARAPTRAEPAIAAASIATAERTAPAETTEVTETEVVRDVALAVEPIEAELLLDGKSLGKSPVIVKVVEGAPLELTAVLAGYRSQTVKLDGSLARLSIRLTPLAPPPQRAGTRGTTPRPRRTTVGPDIADPWAR